MANWTPTAFGSNLKIWHKADALTLNDGDPVSSWTDSSGNGKHAVNATTDEQPTFQTNEVNGLPVVRSDGSNDMLTITGHGITKPYTLAVVLKVNEGSPSNGDRLFAMNSGNNFVCIGGTGVNDYIMAGGSNLQYSTNTLDTNAHIHVFSFASTGNSTGSFDGAAVVGDAGTTATGDNAAYFSTTLKTNFLGADMCEALAVNGTVSAADIARLQGYLAHKWGLTANLPANHLYKTAAPRVEGPPVLGPQRGLRYNLSSEFHYLG